MVTAVLSDLHLGARMSVLSTPPVLERMLRELEAADEVVLLGDVLSLRDGRLDVVLEAARAFFEGLGEAVGDGRVVIVPGNHDHRLAEPLLENRPGGLGCRVLDEQCKVTADTNGPLGALARWMSGPEVVLSYPGVWIRPDVYATHGHYLDCHLTIPRADCVAARAMKALVGLPEGAITPGNYEAVLAPLYAFVYASAQAPHSLDGDPPARRIARRVQDLAWKRISGSSGRGRPVDRLVGAAAALAGTAALRAAGLGPFRADLAPAEIGRAGLRAMTEVVERLEIEAAHVIFGHTHHASPLGGPETAQLVNPGSWVYEPVLVGESGSRSPFWPGRYAIVDSSGPPRLRSVLADPVLEAT